MAKPPRESGRARQKRIQQEQHRPEQNAGYDAAADGAAPSAPPLDATNTTANENQMSRDERRFEHAAREAANDVRRQDKSAS